MRIWVLLDADFRVHVWKKGVLRTCSVPFTLDPQKLDDPFVHLSNHCIQTQSTDYGKHESETNEVWLNDFDAWLRTRRPGASVEGTLAPQWRSIVKATLDAAREHMAVDPFDPPFNCARPAKVVCRGSRVVATRSRDPPRDAPPAPQASRSLASTSWSTPR